MRARGAVALAGLAVLCLAGTTLPAQGRTWRVERDGTGDFTVLQTAVNAAAAGDSLLIGPGRYTEFAPFSLPGWTEPTYVGISVNHLTLIGTDREAVIIGPEVPDFSTYGPKGIVTQVSITLLRVESLTIENVHDGMYLVGRTEVRDCTIRGCDLGIVGLNDRGLLVEGCTFEDNEDAGVDTYEPAQDVEIVDCRFLGLQIGVDAVRTQGCSVRDCTFSDGSVGAFYETSTGEVVGCSFENVNAAAIGSVSGSDVTAIDNMIHGGQTQIEADTSGRLVGHDNLLVGATYATFYLSKSTVELSHNDILPASGYAVRVSTRYGPDFAADLRNNYWGVEDASSIEELIWDQNDDPELDGIVLFEPFEMRSVPTEPTSFGRLKALFAGDQ
jgi:hypothetical protein